MRDFWRFLLRKDLPASSLGSMRHACFGLGDSSYPKFCFAAKRLNRRLEQLGSAPIISIGLGDDQDAQGLDHALIPWLETLWSALDVCMPLPPGLTVVAESSCPLPRYSVQVLPSVSEVASTSEKEASGEMRDDQQPCQRSTSKHVPFCAPVLENVRLTTPGCGRDVRHISLDVSGWGLSYLPGDALAVQPRNPSVGTRALLDSLGFDPSSQLLICAIQVL